jgi:DNA-binding LacI/PurR family transcriptional regulator/DNA-binding CsgD family transcriptional regulator
MDINNNSNIIDIYLLNQYKHFHGFSEFLRGARKISQKLGFELNVIEENQLKIDEYLLVRGRSKDRFVILMGFNVSKNSSMLEKFKKFEIPFIIINKYVQELRNINVVSIDHIAASKDITKHLITNCGRDRIACLGFHRVSVLDTEKLMGYISALEDAGLCYEEGDIYYTGEVSLIESIDEFINHAGKYNAVFCATDSVAVIFMKKAIEHGIRIPEDIAVVGFDGIYMGKYMIPPLTTVKPNFVELGEAAVKAVSILKNDSKIKCMKLVCGYEIIIRGSCGKLDDEYSSQGRSNDEKEMEKGTSVKGTQHEANDRRQTFSDEDFIAIEKLDQLFGSASQTEIKMLGCLMDGLYYKEIAAKLFVSERTIKYYIARMLETVGLKGKYALQNLVTKYFDIKLLDWEKLQDKDKE